MANFPPLKNYIIYCLDRLIDSYDIQGPFLDVGCGIGDISAHLARKGWAGMALDVSEQALKVAEDNLKPFHDVKTAEMSLFELEGAFKTILAMDVIEHLDNDTEALTKLVTLLDDQGHLVLSVPTNPKEWRWDDDFYGHVRRYSHAELTKRLHSCGFTVVEMWDFTFPVFWLMRRIYTRLKKPAKTTHDDAANRTKDSSLTNSWDIPLLSRALSGDSFVWQLTFRLQHSCFRGCLNNGHEAIVLARKR